jgi:phenylacetic acid degradation operon negative regulatory protein
MRITESPPVQTQFLIFTLFGDYIIHRDGTLWTSSLLELMASLDVGERALRSALSRMSSKGWLKSHKQGRLSQYSLTTRGRALLERGAQRIFEPALTNWDRQWYLVVYSLPEKKRRQRHVLRKQLTWLGFGRLAPGTWCSAHDRGPELAELFSELKVEPYVDVFNGRYRGPCTDEELVHRCWHLDSIGAQYQEFLARHEPSYLRCLHQTQHGRPIDAESCFVQRFWLTRDYMTFPQQDPNLPVSLLPPDWIGLRARKIFDDYHSLLGQSANEFVDQALNNGALKA